MQKAATLCGGEQGAPEELANVAFFVWNKFSRTVLRYFLAFLSQVLSFLIICLKNLEA
jgi:hypothetical protein